MSDVPTKQLTELDLIARVREYMDLCRADDEVRAALAPLEKRRAELAHELKEAREDLGEYTHANGAQVVIVDGVALSIESLGRGYQPRTEVYPTRVKAVFVNGPVSGAWPPSTSFSPS